MTQPQEFVRIVLADHVAFFNLEGLINARQNMDGDYVLIFKDVKTPIQVEKTSNRAAWEAIDFYLETHHITQPDPGGIPEI